MNCAHVNETLTSCFIQYHLIQKRLKEVNYQITLIIENNFQIYNNGFRLKTKIDQNLYTKDSWK